MKLILGLAMLLGVGCSSLTHMEKLELKYKEKFSVENITLIITTTSGEKCFATLVSKTTALTSASCISEGMTLSKYYPPEDEVDPEDIEKFEVEKTAVNPDYKGSGSPAHTNIAVVKLKPSELLTNMNVYFPKPLLFKKSHLSYVKKRKTLRVQTISPRLTNKLYNKTSLTENSVQINLGESKKESLLEGAVANFSYFDVYMIDSMLVSDQPQSASPESLILTPLYPARDFLTKHIY